MIAIQQGTNHTTNLKYSNTVKLCNYLIMVLFSVSTLLQIMYKYYFKWEPLFRLHAR